MATALRSSPLNKVCPDNFICLIDLYLFNENISNHFVRSESDFKAWNCNSIKSIKHMKNMILSKEL